MTDALTVSPALLYSILVGLVGVVGTLTVTVYKSRETATSLAALTAAHHALELRVVASEGSVANVLAAIGEVKLSIEKLSDKLDRLRDEQ